MRFGRLKQQSKTLIDSKVKVLYVSYWSLSDPLTEATVFPNLAIIRSHASELYLATIERKGSRMIPLPDSVVHIPFSSVSWLPRFLKKTLDTILFSIRLIRVARSRNIDIVICRGSMAAIFAVVLHKLLGLPFLVESFEPHSEYMVEGKTWSKQSVEYNFQKWIENQTIKSASFLIPVSYSYADHLVKEGTAKQRVIVMPCCVDTNKFRFDANARKTVRKRLDVPDEAVVGIYVGKFGGLYLEEEAFGLFKETNDYFKGHFFLIVLSPQDCNEIKCNLDAVGFASTSFFVATVDSSSVPSYLSAADFSFSLAKSALSMRYLSPVKNGEYWASGLPILLSKSVEDDERIIREWEAGAIFDAADGPISSSLGTIHKIITCGRQTLAAKLSGLAVQYRSFKIIEERYDTIFSQLKTREANDGVPVTKTTLEL